MGTNTDGSVVESGFRRFMKCLDQHSYPPPQCTLWKILSIVKPLITKAMKKVLADARVLCKGEAFVSCILDLWCQRSARRSYIHIGGRLFRKTPQFKAVDLCLGFEEFSARKHDWLSLKKCLTDTCGFWELDGKENVALWAPDGEAAGKKAMRALGWNFWVCDCHQINRAVLYGLGEAGPKDANAGAKRLITVFKKMSARFRKNVQAKGDLHAMQIQLGFKKPLAMVQPGKTRWNGVHAMLKRSNTLGMALCSLAEGHLPRSRQADGETDEGEGDEPSEHESDSEEASSGSSGDEDDMCLEELEARHTQCNEAAAQAKGEESSGSSDSDGSAQGWCATGKQFRLARQFEGGLVDVQETSVLFESSSVQTGKVLLMQNTLISSYEKQSGDVMIPRGSGRLDHIVPTGDHEWTGKTVEWLDPAVQTLQK